MRYWLIVIYVIGSFLNPNTGFAQTDPPTGSFWESCGTNAHFSERYKSSPKELGPECVYTPGTVGDDGIQRLYMQCRCNRSAGHGPGAQLTEVGPSLEYTQCSETGNRQPPYKVVNDQGRLRCGGAGE